MPSCPRCAVPLAQVSARQVDFRDHISASELEVFGCAACGGIWLARSGAEVPTEDALPPDMLRAVAELEGDATRAVAASRPAGPCPVCRHFMTTRPVRAANVTIDVCAEHGTWYDKSELTLVAAAISRAKKAPPTPAPVAAKQPSPSLDEAPRRDVHQKTPEELGIEAAAGLCFWLASSAIADLPTWESVPEPKGGPSK